MNIYMKEVFATKVDYIHITIPCSNPKICKRKEHLYGSCGELQNREEDRGSHCEEGENIKIIINNDTRRPFFNIKKKKNSCKK